jgi:thiamine pyrophosphate-dependent acetolactate synthase large subunit-like protein
MTTTPTTGKPPEGFSDAPEAYPVREGAEDSWVALPDRAERPRSVSDAMVETLIAWGIDTVFGMVGHSNLGFAEALRRAEQRGQLRYIGIRHEGAAALAASAYGKLTGRPAACFAIAGPGSTNLLTGLYDARLDGAPVLAISGQVPSNVQGKGAFQDLDLSRVFADVTISTITVHAKSDHTELAAEAVKHAIDGRGVAHLVLPDEVQDQPSTAPLVCPDGRSARIRGIPDNDAVTDAAALISAAHRPVVIVGHGARHAQGAVLDLA